MKRFRVTGWIGGLVSISVLTVIGLVLVTGAAASDSTTEQGDESDAVTDGEEHPEDAEDTPPARCEGGAEALDEARRLVHYDRIERAHELLEGLLSHGCLESQQHRDLARFQHAYVLHLLERPEAALSRLDALATTPPVDDYVDWLRGRSLHRLEHYEEAAEAFGRIYEADDSRLHWKARTRQADSLFAAEKFERALPILDQIVELLPDYPRRHEALYQRARTLDELERHDQAARAYQQTHFEFPHKRQGQQAAEQLGRLYAEGFMPPEIDPEERYEQYRQLSIDKFWPLAHRLLTGLREDVSTDGPPSELENEILQRIALNAYHSHDFETAAQYFREARSIYEAGHTDGFSESTIYRYHCFALARLGRFDEARRALEALHQDSPDDERRAALARFYERWGQYERAYQLYEEIYSRYQQRQWHFTYLQYKTGRFEEAHDSLRRLARRSRGQTRAQYLYWAGRAMERAGEEERAAELFAESHHVHPSDYYGLQSANRLLDMHQRSTVDDSLLAGTTRLDDNTDAIFDAFDRAEYSGEALDPGTYNVDPRTQLRGSRLVDPATDGLWGPAVMDALDDRECRLGDDCAPGGLGLPFPSYGLTWNLGQPFISEAPVYDNGGVASSNDTAAGAVAASGFEQLPGVTAEGPPEGGLEFNTPDTSAGRIGFNTDGRIYWHGRHSSDAAFASYRRGEMLGPVPDEWTAYSVDTHRGGLERAIETAGELFPRLERARWLRMAGWNTEARREIREVGLEFRSLINKQRPSGDPHELSHERWEYLIDNRRGSSNGGFWGIDDDQPRFPVPDGDEATQQLLERQQQIHDRRRQLRPVIVEALQEVGDYHLVRQFALDESYWLRRPPRGEARRHWEMAYPRAFPELVIPLAEQHNVNPYMIWALMLVESSFNPDSLSTADAIGLLQVIPRTGYKIADLFGAEDFGPFDLLEADTAIEQGIFYFSRLVRKFHGQELMAFAGYNGGPHRVGGWLEMRGREIPLDEFVEEIPFDQSRGYAKKVLRFLYRYLHLYEGYDEGLYVGQNVRPDYLPQPNF